MTLREVLGLICKKHFMEYWELRVGNMRMFYKVVDEEPTVVRVLAVGKKRGNKLFIGGKEIQL